MDELITVPFADKKLLVEKIVGIVSALLSVLGVVQILDAINVRFSFVSHRIWFFGTFQLGFSTVALQSLLLVVWLVLVFVYLENNWGFAIFVPAILIPFRQFEVAVSLASLISAGVTLIDRRWRRDFLKAWFVCVGVLETFALLHWAILYPLGVSSPLEFVARFEAELFYLFGSYTPYVGLTLIFICVLYFALKLFIRKEFPTIETVKTPRRAFSRELKGFIVFVLALSVFAAVYPYFEMVNPRGINTGMDISNYLRNARIVEGDLGQIFNVMGGSRPIIFLVIYGFQRVTGLETLAAIRFLPVILNPLMVLSFFFLVLEATQDRWLAATAAFFTAAGYPVTVNMYSYFLTNVLGLSFVFLSLGFLIRRMRVGERKYLVYASVFGALLVFTHPWTFDQYFVPLLMIAVFLLFFSRSGGDDRVLAFDVFIYTIALGVVDLVKVFFFGGVGGVAASATAIGRLTTLQSFWVDTFRGLVITFDGLYSNLLLLGLAILGIIVSRPKRFFDHYVEVFLGLSSLVFLVGDSTIKSRVFYNFPIGFLAAIGFLSVYRREDKMFRWFFGFFVASVMLVYLFRGLANIV